MANFIPTSPASFCFSGTMESALGAVIQKQKNGEPFAHSRWNYRFQRFIVFSCFPCRLEKIFPPTRHTSHGICEKYHDILHFFRSNGGATLLPAPTGQDFLMRQRPNSNRQKYHTWENHPWWEQWQRRLHHAFRKRKFDSTRAPEAGESDGRVNYWHGVCAHVLLLQRRREHSWLVL